MRTLSRLHRRNYLIALVAAITLISALSVYSAHGFADRDHDNGHCDLCVHFSGTAGSPAQVAVFSKPVLVVRTPTVRPQVVLPRRREAGSHLPRGPPLAPELI